MTWLRAWPAERRQTVSACLREQVRVALGVIAPESVAESSLSPEERLLLERRAKPLLTALHVRTDPALAEILREVVQTAGRGRLIKKR